MSWLNFFPTTESTCNINFGRAINATINPNEEELFYKSYAAFEKKEILDAYEYFFQSLITFNKEGSNNNIIIERKSDELKFEIYQGCSKITGVVTQKTLYAETIITKVKSISVALKRYILERNYQLTYANYFSDEEYIKIKLYQDNITLTPQKVFFPLRELALNSDFDKEHIKSEFKEIVLEDINHIIPLEKNELEVKFKYLQLWIEELEAKVLTLPSNDNSGMQSFLYLNILFKIDYLISPKFRMYQKLSKKIIEYFGNENSTIEAKNEELKKYLLTLKEIDFEEFSKSFYDAKYTFDPIESSSYEDIVIFITESQNKIKWYKSNRYLQIIPTIYDYIAFNSLYNYGMKSVLRELFHTLVEIQNSSYFQALGCTSLYDETSETFSKRQIISKLKKIIENSESKYKNLTISTDDLEFSSLNNFSSSYYTMLKNLDFEEV